MRALSWLIRIWAWLSIGLLLAIVVFLFAFIFYQGAGRITPEFLTASPTGAVLGSEGGIFPAIAGSFAFTTCAVVLASIPAIATALYLVFFCKNRKKKALMRLAVQCLAGIPSIVLGLFAYSVFVKDAGWGRCVLSASIALGIMILPFIEVRAEKAFEEVPQELVQASLNLGCSLPYTIGRIALPMCLGELVSAITLGACYAVGATAPIMFTGAVAFAAAPTSLFEPAMALPMHLYLQIAQGTTSLETAFGTAFVLMALVLISNIIASLLAQRSAKRWKA